MKRTIILAAIASVWFGCGQGNPNPTPDAGTNNDVISRPPKLSLTQGAGLTQGSNGSHTVVGSLGEPMTPPNGADQRLQPGLAPQVVIK